MQVFWVSGPVGRINSFNLSFRTVVAAVLVLTFSLLALGSALQFFGFRLALEYDPQIARRLGNLHTAVELETLNAVYHTRLGELEEEHRQFRNQVGELREVQTKLVELLPAPAAKKLPKARAQGGTYWPQHPPQEAPHSTSVLQRLEGMGRTTRSDRSWLSQEIQGWTSTLSWLEGLPIGVPVAAHQLSLSSGFGVRADPMTQRRAMHTGLDFELPTGSDILAAGSGKVTQAGWDGQYGKTVVIAHHDGHSTRYAHANDLLVKPGDKVERGQLIAKSGNTGRSTGPHLHFEVLKDGKPVDPTPYLWALNPQR
jgi:murein DD-endopeptidase MepM/ murein hydrolase activator NlpD